MRKLILIFFFSLSFIFAQEENQSQSIELPDFVITGNEKITIPKVQKSYPDLIPLLSKDFFTPLNISDDQTSIELPKVENKIVSIPKYLQTTHAMLKLNAGLYTWPAGEFYYNNWIDNFSYNAHIFGLNELEYVKNAGLSYGGLSLGSSYYLNNNSHFLPGLEISLHGNYLYESFNFFGSDNSNLERITNNGFAELSLNYITDPISNFGLVFNDKYYKQKDDEISENIFGTNAFVKFKVYNSDIKLEGSYKNQSVNSESGQFGNTYFYNILGTLTIHPFNFINLRGGIYFSESNGNTFFTPYAYGSIKLNKSLTVYGEFSPNTEFKTLSDFRDANRYYQLNNFTNLFIENKVNFKAAVKYEYERYFEISAGAGYLNSDNNFYFEDNIKNGFFTIYKDDIENTFAFVNFLFRRGPFGQFYSELKLQHITGSNSKKVPYHSSILADANYSYSWTDFEVKLKLNYFSESFTDFLNTNKIPAKINAGIDLSYEIFENFDLTLSLQNLLNDKYYYFRNYKAKPFDLIAGFEFRW